MFTFTNDAIGDALIAAHVRGVQVEVRLSTAWRPAAWAASAIGSVLAELDLMSYLSRHGHAEHIGSSVSGLMLWRDLDLGARCPQPSAERVFETLQPILAHSGIHEVLYREETGPRSTSGQEADQRYYFVLRYATAAGQR
ncbi:MAG TPA: hypothetical protein VFO07_19180 [Roseiflexaceae bacterium]|nr:hypothetical protein [Roseiflexaceae bacterium]